MEELIRGSLPFILPGLLPTLALLHVPLVGRRLRLAWAILLGAIALGFAADVLLIDHGGTSTVQVKNPFPRVDGETPFPWVVDEVTAPAWQWHAVVIVWFGLVAAYAWLVRNRTPGAPRPVPVVVIAFACALAARLALDKTAAPEHVAWAIGGNWTLLTAALFVGWYAGSRGRGFGAFALTLLLANALSRALVVTAAYFATTQDLGTHLDVRAITEFYSPLAGEVTFSGPTDQWLRLILLPQMILATVAGTVVGLALGVLPWWIARRRAARAAPAAD